MKLQITNHACERFRKRFFDVKALDAREAIRSILACSEIERSARYKSKSKQYAFTNGHFKALGIKRGGEIFITTVIRNGHE